MLIDGSHDSAADQVAIKISGMVTHSKLRPLFWYCFLSLSAGFFNLLKSLSLAFLPTSPPLYLSHCP